MRVKGLLVFLLATALATVAAAQTKISGTLLCAKPDPFEKVDVGDRANHALAIAKVQCTWTRPFEIAGSQAKDGASVSSAEVSGNKSTTLRGIHTGTMANGDKYFVRFHGTEMSKDGAPQSSRGAWSFTGGSGKLKGLKGKGTYKGKPDANGNMVFDIEGAYQLP